MIIDVEIAWKCNQTLEHICDDCSSHALHEVNSWACKEHSKPTTYELC